MRIFSQIRKRMKLVIILCSMAFFSSSVLAEEVFPLPNIDEDVAMIDREEIIDILKAHFDQEGIEGDIDINLLNVDRAIRLRHKSDIYDVQISELDVKPHVERFRARVLFSSQHGDEEMVLNGRFKEQLYVPVLVKRLSSGSVISEDDLVMMRIDKKKIRHNIVTSIEELIGKSLEKTIPAERPLRVTDVGTPRLVTRRAPVSIIYQTPFISIKTMGVAMEDGARGDTIKVKNSTSNTIVDAVVSSANTVSILAYGNSFVR